MCGIFGIAIDSRVDINSSSQFGEEFLLRFENSISTLAHRGPDASGSEYFRNEGVFLRHSRLAF